MAVVGIIVFCGVLVGLFAWLLNRPERPKDPEEDREQEEYLTEWRRKHEKEIKKAMGVSRLPAGSITETSAGMNGSAAKRM
mgnify:CR=1 FL=1